MIIKSSILIEELQNYTNNHLNFVKELSDFNDEQLQIRENETSWSILECIEHLNLYGKFYIPKIKKALEKSNHKASNRFKSGFLGNKFALSMLPNEQMKTMNTFKSKNPIHATLDRKQVVQEFLKQQNELLYLLEISKHKNLTKIYTATTLPLIKFRLGDTFRFVIYHNERHIVQAKRVLINFQHENL